MNYNDYKVSRNLAWEILLEEKITELPVRVAQICRQMGIQVKMYEPADDNDGYSTIINSQAFVFISSKASIERQRFTAAHELGHILLGHTGKYVLTNREPSGKDNPIEQAANVFASRLLAPACVLWGCNAHTPEEIMKLCHISRTAAEFRAERMKLLYDRNKFLISPIERQVYQQFLPYIKEHTL